MLALKALLALLTGVTGVPTTVRQLVEAAAAEGGANAAHRGAAAHDTGSFGPRVGNLRIDYVLPSVGQRVTGNGVFWPPSSSPQAAIVDGTDHRLVWVDVLRD